MHIIHIIREARQVLKAFQLARSLIGFTPPRCDKFVIDIVAKDYTRSNQTEFLQQGNGLNFYIKRGSSLVVQALTFLPCLKLTRRGSRVQIPVPAPNSPPLKLPPPAAGHTRPPPRRISTASWAHSFRGGPPKPPFYSRFRLPSFSGETSTSNR